jgi:signal transduction histidine kinase
VIFLLARRCASDAQWKPGRSRSFSLVVEQHSLLHQLPTAAFLKGWHKQMSTDKTGDRTTELMEQRLRSLIAEYEAKFAEIADLVAHVRHEINNPLTGVIGQAQLLLREELSPTARRRVETIEQLAARIRDTVAQLRDIQRPTKK